MQSVVCMRRIIFRTSLGGSVRPLAKTACVLGINAPPVTIKNIEKNIVDRGFDEGWIKPEPPKFSDG